MPTDLPRRCLWLLATVLVVSVAEAELVNQRPNIILIMTDDQGYAPISRHGHSWIRTPHLDELYDKSTRFTRFHVSPTCSPTRSALMTGRHPMKNGVTHTILERERMTLDAVTLPQVLQTVGYTTGIFGKWHLGDEEPYQPHRRGFDETFIHGGGGIGQAYNCSCADAPGNTYVDPIIRHNGTFVRTRGYCTDLFFTAAMGFIKQHQDKQAPFFAYIATNAPHGPFVAPEKNAERFRQLGFAKGPAGFYGMIENIDDNVGRLMAKLQAWQLLENTLIVFLSDNGMAGGGSGRGKLGQRADGSALFAYNAGMKGQKGSVDEGGTRVPAFFRWDGHLTPGREITTIAAHIDLFPTLAAIAGAPWPRDQVEGRSLTPLLESATTPWSHRYLFTHQGRWPTGANSDDYQWRGFAVRDQRFRFVNDALLFDMENDPGQTRNVIEEHPEVVAQMRAAYDRWWKETRPLMINEEAPLSPTRPFHVLYEHQLRSDGIPDWNPPQL